MKKIILFLIIIFINFSCHVTPVSRIPFDKIKGPFSRKDLTETPAENENIVNSTNIHYNVKYCSECHIRIPTNKKDDSTFKAVFRIGCQFNGNHCQKLGFTSYPLLDI